MSGGWKVQLAIYDISMGMASQLSMSFLGEQIEAIYHTGIIVYGKEFFFGGGIQQCPHEQFVASHGGIRPIQLMDLGTTDVPEEVFQDFLREISPRFTMATYDLIKNNCNNFTDACADFLLGQGIPQHIVGLPERVFSTPMGQMIRPMIENMQNSINNPAGGSMTLDPFASSANMFQSPPPPSQPAPSVPAAAAAPTAPPVPAGWVTTPAAAPAPAAAPLAPQAVINTDAPATTPASEPLPIADSTPTLDKYSKPLLSADRNGVKANVVAGLKKKIEQLEGFSMDEAQLQTLDALADALSLKGQVPEAAPAVISHLLSGPEALHFFTLCILRLVVLPPTESFSETLESVLRLVVAKIQDNTITSPAALMMGLCVMTNLFATAKGIEFLLSPDVIEPCLDSALQKLHHERAEVRMLACTILHNYALHLPEASEDVGPPDQATQILLGAIEGIESETDQQSCLRRCLSIGHLVKKYKTSMTSLMVDLGFDVGLADLSSSQEVDAETKKVAVEVSSILKAV